jgi:signal peptidase I
MPVDGLPWDGEERPVDTADVEVDGVDEVNNKKEHTKESSNASNKKSKDSNEESSDISASDKKEPSNDISKPPDALHKRVVSNVKKRKKQATDLKRKWMPGVLGEIFTFLFALLLAYLFIQTMGYLLNTPMPLVVVESESMVHDAGWKMWLNEQEIGTDLAAFGGGMGIGDIILVKGDDTKDVVIGDVIIYQKLRCDVLSGGEPIIHRVVGIVDIKGDDVTTNGAVMYADGIIKTPCNYDDSYGFPLESIRSRYSEGFGFDTQNFRLFITKGDNPGNTKEDQCIVGPATCAISYPVHENLVIGQAKFDIPYIGYVKLGLVCGINVLSGNVCPNRCWWPASHPQCD